MTIGQLLKQDFMAEAAQKAPTAKYLVVAVKLPTGAIELITNTSQICSKCDYYAKAYDEEFRLRTNGEIQIVGYMIV